jgi:hypothetical protein
MTAGAKEKYNPDTFPLLAEGYAREGMIDKDIAAKLGISQTSFYEYLKKYPKFSEALNRGKVPVDIEVENALLQRAKGYEYEEKSTTYIDDGTGRPKIKETKTVKKFIPPDTTAQIFWLKNRKSKEWKDRQDVELTGNIQMIQITEEQNKLLDEITSD